MIKSKTFDILNDPKAIARKEEIFRRLSLYYDGKTDGTTCHLKGVVCFPDVNPYTCPEQWMDAALDYLADNAEAINDADYIRPLCVEYGFYGVHFVDKIFGADVFAMDGNWNANYLKTPVGALEPPQLEKNPTFLLAKNLLEAFLAAKVSLPVFGLPTIASALNIALNLYGQDILTAMYTDEQAVAHDLRVINDVLIALHEFYRKNLPPEQLQPVVSWERTQPYEHGQLCGCSTQMISKTMYDEFIAPLDDELLGVYPRGGMIHLCGSHTQLLGSFKAMKNLHALQFHNRAAADLEKYYRNLRDDQVIYLNVCEEMPYKRALEITEGKRIIFIGGEPTKI